MYICHQSFYCSTPKTLSLAVALAISPLSQAAVFDNYIENGIFDQANGIDHQFVNNLTVNGNWNLNSAGSSTDMFFNGAQTLGGTGFINLSDNTQNRIFSSGNALLTIGADLTISGAGQLGINQTFFDNQGTILAQGANTLTIDSSSFTNNGVVRAEGSGGLVISTSVFNNSTALDVDNNSQLLISGSTINNGIINNTLGGTVTAQASTFDHVTVNGAVQQNNAQDNAFLNGLTVNGSWNLDSGGGNTDMSFSGAQTLTGMGEVVMSDNSQNRIFSAGNALLTIDSDVTIRGAGQLGVNQTFFDNQGTILAQGANTLTIDSGSFTNNGVLRAEGSGGLVISTSVVNNNTALDVGNNSQLLITSSVINNGIINNTLGGTVTALASTFDHVTVNGAVQQNNAQDNVFLNGLTVNGSWNLDSGGGNTDMSFSGAQTLTGVGEIIMSDNAQNRIYSSGNALLTVDSDITIRGAGQLGVNQTFFDNQGTILAQGNTKLSIDSNNFINNGVLRAEGAGGLVITGSILNNNSSVDVDSGSKLVITSSSVNGIFNIAAGGDVTALASTFDASTINGVIRQDNAQDNAFVNGLTVNGSWNLLSGGGATDMAFNGAQTINGSGAIVMSDNTQNRIFASGNALLTIDTDTTIQGAGQIGVNQTFFDNQGTILAQGNNTLSIDSNNFTNNGVLRAEGAGGLVIAGSILNNNSSVDVASGSKLVITSSTVNGVFNTAAGGDSTALASTFDAATINGVISQNNAQDNAFVNGLTVNGSWNLLSGGSATDMTFNGAQTITGPGTIVMSDNTQNRIFAAGNALLTIDTGTTIQGAGQIGVNQTSVLNKGMLAALGTSAMTIDTGGTGLDNQGTLKAGGTGGMNIAAGNFTTSGNVIVEAGSKVVRAGTYIQTAGETTVNGLLQASGLVEIQGGLLSGSGLVSANVTSSGTVGPGNSAGLLSIDGDYTQSSVGLIDIEIAGLLPDSGYDVLAVTGTADLGGTLELSIIDGFALTIGDSFDILTAETINGSFDILMLALGNSNWQVQYLIDEIGTTDVVRLTALTSAVPVPAAAWLFGSALLGLLGMAKRSKHQQLAIARTSAAAAH